MGQQVAAKRTPATAQQVADALWNVWPSELGGRPSLSEVCVLLAQWSLETADGSKMICWNVGNSKQPTDDHDWCMFSTEEYVNGEPVTLHPPDPGCRFRAFASLADGVQQYLRGMWSHWTAAWPSVARGDPEGFAYGLKQQGYYTEPVATYADGVKARFTRYMSAIELPSVDPNADTQPG
jgi:flagellum-specific peptidoglycan hydrolase FlgJ